MKKYRIYLAFAIVLLFSNILFCQKKIGIAHESSIFYKYPYSLAVYYDKPLKKRNQRFILYTYQSSWDETNNEHISGFEESQNEWRIGFDYALNLIPARYRLTCFFTTGIAYANYESHFLYSLRMTNEWKPMDAMIKTLNVRNGINLEYRIPLWEKFECIVGYSHYVLIAELGKEKILLDDKLFREGIRDRFSFASETAFRIGVQYRID